MELNLLAMELDPPPRLLDFVLAVRTFKWKGSLVGVNLLLISALLLLTLMLLARDSINRRKGAARYLQKFHASFSAKVAPLHVVTAKGKSFHWSKQHQKSFDYFERIISQAPVPAMPNLQQPFQNRH